MQASSGTSCLRNSAARWSLAGDKILLNVLQEIHQNMISKCDQTNSALASLTNALSDADIALQTVNNRMMALSNSQFVESRVYDDELPATEEVTEYSTPTKISENESERSKLKRSIRTLESLHEVVEIHHDSESETDSDLELYSCRVVLKPLDVYADRPLPHIIGTHAWKTKWHAGLYPEDSDSESVSSQEYEEPENIPEVPGHTEAVERLESSCSSEVGTPEMSQAEVAAALARRLAGEVSQIPEREVEYSVPEPTLAKEYQPKPLSAVREPIFFDEPPPLDETYQSDEDTYSQEDDIFAELYKSKPNAPGNLAQSRVTDELFCDLASNVEGDLFGRVQNIVPKDYDANEQNTVENKRVSMISQEKVTPQPQIVAKSVLSEENKPKLSTQSMKNPDILKASKKEAEAAVKKPIGGISLFGNNEGAERIGAAILKRHQRKSSMSSNESENDNIPKTKKEQPQHTGRNQQKELKSKENLQNLFAKQEKTQHAGQNIKPTEKEKNDVKKNVDLFSDNLFDDVDDIFTSNIVVKIPKKEASGTEKSIFDDDDDLFSEVAVKKDTKETKIITTPKSLFDSDDELFSERNIIESADMVSTSKSPSHDSSLKPAETIGNVTIASKNVVSEESDDDIFSGMTSSLQNNKQQTEKYPKSGHSTEKSDYNIFTGIVTRLKSNVTEDRSRQDIVQSNVFRSTVKEDDDIFSEKKSILQETKYTDIQKNTHSQRFPIRDNSIKDIDEDRKLTSEDADDVLVSKNKGLRSETVLSNDPEAPIGSLSGLSIVLVKESEENDMSDKDDILSSRNEKNEVSNMKSPNIFDDNDMFETHTVTKTGLQNEKEKPVIQIDKQLNSVAEKLNESKMKAATKVEKQADIMDSTMLFNEELLDTRRAEQLDTSFLPRNLSNPDKHEIISDTIEEQPPVFEKPKEPKKSKNINALFDDDSDDETLFFKSSDLDDKPEGLNFHNTQDKLFGIFHDEPPAFDIDFTHKPSKSHDISVRDSLTKQFENNIVEKENIITPQIDKDFPVSSISGNEGLVKHSSDESDNTKEVKLGKLKLPNLNINVNTLLPGASPKKILKVTEQTDGQSISKNLDDQLFTTLSKDLNPNPDSISLDKQSTILDNKISKERAKIQVKRRPSTRHARREAVRKSMVFARDDSTDNSNYFDNNENQQRQNISIEDSIIKVNSSNNVISKTVYILNDEDIFPNKKPVAIQSTEETKTQEEIKEVPKTESLQIIDDDFEEMFKSKTDSTSDVSYGGLEGNNKNTIATLGKYMDKASHRDETVESKKSHEVPSTSNTHSTDALPTIATIKNKNEEKVEINTENSKKTTKSSLFDDLSDEESKLFGVTKAAMTPKSNIFDSDNEDELFAGVNKREKIKKEEVAQIKGSLFGNDYDDVDLFGAPGKKTEHVGQATASSVKGQISKSRADATVRDPLFTLLDED